LPVRISYPFSKIWNQLPQSQWQWQSHSQSIDVLKIQRVSALLIVFYPVVSVIDTTENRRNGGSTQ
jgi:hypothetical protein